MIYVLSALSVATFALCAAEELVLPVTTCNRNSTDYITCLKHAIREAWPRFVKGLPEFDFPSLDPLVYEYGRVFYNRGDVHGEVIVSNASSIGLSKLRLLDVRSYFLNNIVRLEIDGQVPRILLEGDVKAQGSLGGFKMGGKGYFNITAEDLRATWLMTGHVENDTLIVERFHSAPSIAKMKFYFDDLFEGNKELNDLAVAFINEYWPPLYRVMLPISAEVWDPWLTDLCNRLFSKVSFSKVFP